MGRTRGDHRVPGQRRQARLGALAGVHAGFAPCMGTQANRPTSGNSRCHTGAHCQEAAPACCSARVLGSLPSTQCSAGLQRLPMSKDKQASAEEDEIVASGEALRTVSPPPPAVAACRLPPAASAPLAGPVVAQHAGLMSEPAASRRRLAAGTSTTPPPATAAPCPPCAGRGLAGRGRRGGGDGAGGAEPRVRGGAPPGPGPGRQVPAAQQGERAPGGRGGLGSGGACRAALAGVRAGARHARAARPLGALAQPLQQVVLSSLRFDPSAAAPAAPASLCRPWRWCRGWSSGSAAS